MRSAHKRDALFCTGIHDSSSCPVLEEHGNTHTYIYFMFIVLTVPIEHVELLHQECRDVSVTRSIGVTLSDWCVFFIQVGLNRVWIGIVFGILAGSYVLFAIPSGKLSDKFVSPTHSK